MAVSYNASELCHVGWLDVVSNATISDTVNFKFVDIVQTVNKLECFIYLKVNIAILSFFSIFKTDLTFVAKTNEH